ncbi:hypothetical protein [Cerasicoccus maritimus]|uniref:hypothetical protein n=1 Tax=Cerasicoccus maritimus TaxID=490089 RepID=UPI0028527F2D|nr:hypothetical protein [Cerasicoccus maritimus]
MTKFRYLSLTFLFVLLPLSASANAGTPLMWASMAHLVLGNALIGLGEGLLLAILFGGSKLRSILLLVAANYASAWAGGFLFAKHLPSWTDITILNIQSWIVAFVILAFLITLLLEFPFVWFALRRSERKLSQTVMATIVVNIISYIALVGWYWMASGTTLLSDLEVVSFDDMAISEPCDLYFISLEGDQVFRLDIKKPGTVEVVAEVEAHGLSDRLFARTRERSGFDLLVHCDQGESGGEKELIVLENFSALAPVEWRMAEGHSETASNTWFNFGAVPSISQSNVWEYYTGFWSIEGLNGNNLVTGEKVHFSLELPFAAWPIRNATQLEGDYVVAQIGENQICLIHPPSKRIALIARGKGPMVAKPKPTSESE